MSLCVHLGETDQKKRNCSRFNLIFARKIHFSENSSREFWPKTGRSLSLLKITKPQGVLGMGGALASDQFAQGVHAHGV